MWNYSEEVREHYLRPHNVGEIDNPDGIAEVGNLKCGDALRLTFKLDKQGRIANIKFKTFGCGSAIASSSILTDLCKGKTLEEAEKITNKEIAKELGGLPPEKMHCSVMGQEALEKAIRFYKNGGKADEEVEKKGEIICTCFNITDIDIKEAIRDNKLKTVDEVTNYTKAGGGCGGCIPKIEEILAEVNGSLNDTTKPEHKQLTTLEKIDLIRTVMENDISPLLQRDGGDCKLIDVEGDKVKIAFTGHCKKCSFSSYTQTTVVEKILKEKVHPDLFVTQD